MVYRPDPASIRFIKYVATVIGVAFFYFVLGKLGIMLSVPPGFATIIWPPSGLALAACIAFGNRVLPGVFAGSFLVNLSVSNHLDLISMMNWDALTIPTIIALGSTLQAAVTRQVIVKLFGYPVNVHNARQLLTLVLCIIPLNCAIASSAGVGILYIEGIVLPENVGNNWVTWWLGDFVGILIFTPVVLCLPILNKAIMWRGQNAKSQHKLAVFFLLIPVAVTFYAWKISSVYMYEKNEMAFGIHTNSAFGSLRDRLNSYKYALKGGYGFFMGSNEVSYDEWNEYVESLELDKNFKGINGIGWINRVKNEELQEYLHIAREKIVPDFNVHPDQSLATGERYIITYISPLERNRQAIGLDVAFEKNRFEAATKAMETGEITITKRIALVQDAGKTPGFLIYVPVYKKGMPTETVSQRQKNLIGWIYAPFIAKSFMDGVSEVQGKYLHIRVYDGQKEEKDSLVYSSYRLDRSLYHPRYTMMKEMDVGHRKWTIVFESTPAFEAEIKSYEPVLILVGGTLITTLFAGLLISLFIRANSIQKEVEKKTEEIQGHQRQLQMIFDNVPARIWYKDDKNNILKLNRQAAKSMGGEIMDFEGRNTKEFFPDMADKYLQDDLIALNGNKPLLGIVENYKPIAGEENWIRTDKVPFTDPITGTKTLLVVSQDITEAMKVEENLKLSEERYDLAVKGMSAGLWDVNLKTGEVFWSEQYKKIIGIKDQDFIANLDEFKNRLYPEDKEKVIESIHRHFNEKTPHDMEFRMRHEDGHYVWVHGTAQAIWDEVGNVIRVAGSIVDISERKFAESALIRSEELNNLAVRGMSVGLWDWNILTGEITMSYKMHEILHWNFGKSFTSNFDELIERLHPDDVEKVTNDLHEHLENRVPYDTECRIKLDTGEYIWIQTCGQAKWDDSGAPTRMVGSIADINSRKQAEEHLIQSNAELERFAYVASHDLQEPLRMIRNFTQLLSEEYGKAFDHQAEEYMKYIINGAARMQNLVSDLLEYSRVNREGAAIEDVDTGKILQVIKENLKQMLLESNGSILHGNLPVIQGNPVYITSLLQNLIVNGMKYRNKNVTPEIRIHVDDKSDFWLFSVSDNGIGIKEEYREQIFMAFKRLHRNSEYQGTGIGLAICKKIIEGMGGKIWVESDFGKGSTFFFTIPKTKQN